LSGWSPGIVHGSRARTCRHLLSARYDNMRRFWLKMLLSSQKASKTKKPIGIDVLQKPFQPAIIKLGAGMETARASLPPVTNDKPSTLNTLAGTYLLSKLCSIVHG